MTIGQALLHPIVGRHPAIRQLAKAQQKLDRARQAQLERTREADAAHRQALAKWQAEHDQAVLDGRPELPPKPASAPSTTGQAAALLVAEGERLRQAATDLLADLAPQLVLKVAAYLDEQLDQVRQRPVAALPDALGPVNSSRQALRDIARTRWSPAQLPKPPEPLDAGQLCALALGPGGTFTAMWTGIVEADRAAAERAARQAAEMEQLGQRAAAQSGKLVQQGLGRADPVPPEIQRVGWAR